MTTYSHAEISPAAAALDRQLGAVAPGIDKWASICVIKSSVGGTPLFAWHSYRDTAEKTDFWPASTIKVYAAIAALELLHEHGFALDARVRFEHQEKDGSWVRDCTRGIREMLHAVFVRSSNEDYTLLLRMTGIDRINTRLLVPDRGFPSSALMRGYVIGRPYQYIITEPQRITLSSAPTTGSTTISHTWSGRSYAQERGCTVLDPRTGNMTSPRELAECLRRIMFHEHLPPNERYHLSQEQILFLRHGGDSLTGLETTAPDSGPSAWTNAIADVFPKARFYHKSGVISNYALDMAAVDNTAASGHYFILVPVVNAGTATKPDDGEKIVSGMSKAIAQWIHSLPANIPPSKVPSVEFDVPRP